MAAITVRNIEEPLKARLRVRAAEHGVSMEEEARRILRAALLPPGNEGGLGTRISQQIRAANAGGELPLPSRSLPRPPPDLGPAEE
jgi:plasmid stability protein